MFKCINSPADCIYLDISLKYDTQDKSVRQIFINWRNVKTDIIAIYCNNLNENSQFMKIPTTEIKTNAKKSNVVVL